MLMSDQISHNPYLDWMKEGLWNWLSQCLSQPVKSGFWKHDSQNTTFPQRERSERVGLSACVKHGHVAQLPNCKWLLFDYIHPSTQTLVA